MQHLLLGIVGPFFLALSAPVTLALQAFERPTQVNLLRALRSRPVRWVSHPVVVFSLFAFSLFVLYFSPIYELSLRNDVVHAWVHLHFIVVGTLFFWVAIGLDPAVHRISYGTRLLIVLLTIPFHAFLGVALMNTAQSLAPSFDATQAREGQPPVLEDQHAGGAVMWTFGDLVGLAAGGVIALQWFHHEERRTRRLDRRLDALDGRDGLDADAAKGLT
jgi:putative copper resistance protein D